MRISTPRGGIEPFYFGMSTKPLFGCYHAPLCRLARECGVILCYPMGQEYIRSHRACRQLVIRLAGFGFCVLRFDFYGCGDSGGESEQAGIGQWLTDVSTAISEMRRRCGLTKICLVGLRLGAALSMMAGAEQGDVESLVLWDPVVSGRAYIDELMTWHQETLGDSPTKIDRHGTGEKQTEILGTLLTDSMLADIAKINLLAVEKKPANDILIIESHQEPGTTRLRKRLESIDVHLTYQHCPDRRIWSEKPYKALLPSLVLQSIVSWICQVYP